MARRRSLGTPPLLWVPTQQGHPLHSMQQLPCSDNAPHHRHDTSDHKHIPICEYTACEPRVMVSERETHLLT